MIHIMRLFLVLVLLAGTMGLAQTDPTADTTGTDTTTLLPPAPVTNLTGRDRPNDHGHSIILSWIPSVNDFQSGTLDKTVLRYRIMLWRPDAAYRVDTLRQMYEQLRSNLPPDGVFGPLIEAALEMIDQGITNADLAAVSG